jgi:DegV family protein with EDD domain
LNSIRIVTDSTCDLPEQVVAEHGIVVVPDYIHIDGHGYLDGVDISRQEFYERLVDCPLPPKTAAPPPEHFARAYRQLAAEGATAVLSIHPPDNWSALLSVVRLAAEETDEVPVTVLDSRQISLGAGFVVMAAAEAATRGRSVPEIADLVEEVTLRTHVFALVDTLEFLRRSGRVSDLLSRIGTLLDIKPLLKVHNRVISMEKSRTRKRGLRRLIRLVNDLGPLEHLGLLHTHAPDRVEALRQEARHLFPKDKPRYCLEATPVIGTHTGPGAVGLACVVARGG